MSIPLVFLGLFLVALAAGAFAGSGDAAFPGRNGKIAFTWNSRLYVMNADGSDSKRVAGPFVLRRTNTDPEFISTPRWSPNGRRIAFSCARKRFGTSSYHEYPSGSICLVNADGSGFKVITPAPIPCSGRKTGVERTLDTQPTWSPDGKRIAYTRGCHWGGRYPKRGFKGFCRNWNAKKCIYVVNADGSGRHELVSNAQAPSWSPDGRKLAFISGRYVFLARANGAGRKRVYGFSVRILNHPAPDWSPDGQWLTLDDYGYDVVRRVECTCIYVIKADGTMQRPGISDHIGIQGRDPAFSPDGTMIAVGMYNLFRRENDIPKAQLVMVNRDGSNGQFLGVRGFYPAWQPLRSS